MSSQDTDDNWIEPRSLEEAFERRDQVLTEVQDIQDQLGEPERLIEAHQMTDAEYREWRGKAKVAMRYRLSDYRRLKAWIQLNRGWSSTLRGSPPPDELNPIQTAKRLRDITGKLYSVFLAVGRYLEDESESNLRGLAGRYEQAAAAMGSPQDSSSAKDRPTGQGRLARMREKMLR